MLLLIHNIDPIGFSTTSTEMDGEPLLPWKFLPYIRSLFEQALSKQYNVDVGHKPNIKGYPSTSPWTDVGFELLWRAATVVQGLANTTDQRQSLDSRASKAIVLWICKGYLCYISGCPQKNKGGLGLKRFFPIDHLANHANQPDPLAPTMEQRNIPRALGSHHQPGQRASLC